MTIAEMIEKARADRASDIHLVCGLAPRCRVDGSIRQLCGGVLTPEQCLSYVRELAGEQFDAMVDTGEAEVVHQRFTGQGHGSSSFLVFFLSRGRVRPAKPLRRRS